MFSRGFEIAPDCSGRPERINHSEFGIAWHGRRMGQRHGAWAVSGRGGGPVDLRSEYALATRPGLEERQYLPVACKLPRGSAVFAGSRRAREKVTSRRLPGHDALAIGVRAGGTVVWEKGKMDGFGSSFRNSLCAAMAVEVRCGIAGIGRIDLNGRVPKQVGKRTVSILRAALEALYPISLAAAYGYKRSPFWVREPSPLDRLTMRAALDLRNSGSTACVTARAPRKLVRK